MTFRFPRPNSAFGLRGLALALALGAAPARAQSALDLAWDAPAECPNGAAVLARVRALAGETLRGSRLHAVGRVERAGGRYRLTLSLQQGADVRERKMESVSCDDLAGAAAVALGLLLRKEPTAAGGAATAGTTNGTGPGGGTTDTGSSNPTTTASDANGASASASNPNGNKAQSSTPKEPTAPVTRPPSERRNDETPPAAADADSSGTPRRWNVLLRAPFGTVGVGLLSRPTLALGGGVGFRYDDWRVMAVGRTFEGATQWSEDFPELGVHIARVAADLDVCRQWRSGRLELAPCANAELSLLTARGKGPHVAPASQHARILALGAGADARLFLVRWLAVFAEATFAIETSRPAFLISDSGKIPRLGPVEGSLGLGTEWIF
ncbi:MAG TPA: hypothetical protein VMI54_28835 [Polyangiaceae bacterium]|nr:hypothetical protein [Polyangiaceae bacterium]